MIQHTLRSLFGLDDDTAVTGLSADSRQIKTGMVFAALPGVAMDGRDFISKAVDQGAVGILSIPGTKADVPVVESAKPRLAYARAAAKLFPGQPKTLVAMTGTNGKSSTVDFLRQIWVHAGLNAACFGTLGATSPAGYKPMTHTTPDALALHQTLSSLEKEGVTHVAMEASSHGLKQYRMDAVNITASGFSNLTQDHFDYHPSMQDYFAAKARLFIDLTPRGAPVVINTNDKYGQHLVEVCQGLGQDVLQVGWTGTDIRIDEVMPHSTGQKLTLIVRGERHIVDLPLAGEFQALNAVAALGLALKTGVEVSTALDALAHLKGVAGRLELAGVKNGASVYVDFAHTEDGLDKLLRSVRPHTAGDIIVVFGCGGDRDAGKRAKMGAVAAKLADQVIVTDDNPRTENAAEIRKAVLIGCPDATEIGDRAMAIAAGIERLKPQDCLVIAGKGHEQGQIVGDKIIPFSDVDVARGLLS
ncbi:UDP-N-acetylmuramoyl-L-alanyl-D-glutamate--2,6-diaminopimelate ligase [Litorimonas cladophorae]|uniref:UDP-N-acetylmuramoyl-L-alanyl-D-glutamate--2,6-diaminopimelate ligase n=1 Tax=Litorimonas cladophorae TaxID=1220491 RepID=A0A918KEV8_9PROT|nr:UDP-N-acetylmuramoyl-L-alanyl-D-glutamate--2,6-diaminopimelate ligase [Litorimonas cladophorae]GGX60968.1 UDP-N-acetylmuramoyl-L-alanyl-D-glutamate--2,6-diaminopimelate ligase [Litorimonas cladophorae]